jgi:hypothetical protein
MKYEFTSFKFGINWRQGLEKIIREKLKVQGKDIKGIFKIYCL